MGVYYARQQALRRSWAADAARWKAMVEYYAALQAQQEAQEAQRLQRSWAADAARWRAMGEYYSALHGRR